MRRTTARARPRRRRSSSRSTVRAARASGATASAQRSSTTRRSSFPTRIARSAMARSIRGACRATRTSAARSPSSRSASASRPTRRGRSSPRRSGTSCCTRKVRGYKGIFPFLVDLEEKRYKQYIRVFLRQYQTRARVSDCHGAKLQPESLQVRVDGPQHRRGERAAGRSAARVAVDASSLTDFERAGRGAHSQGSARSRAVPLRRRPELSDAQPRDAHAVGRRGAAHRTRELARLAARRHALRARRAVDRSASARHRASASAAAPAARRRQHGARRRARSGDDSRGRLHGGAGTGERRARRTGRVRGPDVARQRERRSPARTSPAQARDPAAGASSTLGPRWLTLTGAREHNLKGVDVRIPLGAVTVRDGRLGLGQEHARARRADARARDCAFTASTARSSTSAKRVGAFDDDHRRRGARRRRDDRSEPDRQVAALESRDVREGVRRDPPHLRRRAAAPASAVHARAPSASTSPAAAARRARARATSRSRWCSWPTCTCRATTAAASGSSPRCSTCASTAERSTTCSS